MNQPQRKPDRRTRVRQSTMEEIRSIARRQLIAHGPEAVSVNAVAREMGMSGPALYRYYASREALVQAVTADFYRELTDHVRTAQAVHGTEPTADRLMSMCRALRGWATSHPAEFARMFAAHTTVTGPESASHAAAAGFETAFRDEFAALWRDRGFPVTKPSDLDPALRSQLNAYCRSIDNQLPCEAAHVFLKCWTRLYGLLCMEVLHQLDFAFQDMEPVFEEMLREISALLGLEYTAPQR